MLYLALKFLHIVAAIIFVGNITTSAFWAAQAHKSRDLRLIASTFDGIIRAVHLAAEVAGTGTGTLDWVKATVPVTVAFER